MGFLTGQEIELNPVETAYLEIARTDGNNLLTDADFYLDMLNLWSPK